jgi:GNAT superfamily N-acetyltransferase
VSSSFTLREMLPSDGPALIKLGEESPDTGRVGMHSVFVHDAYETLLALHPSTVGVLAEVPDHDGIVGNGLVRFWEGQVEGKLHRMAYLNGLHVHPDYRRRGIASAIAEWRIKTAREQVGEDGVIFAGIQAGNEGSVATAQRWMTQSIRRVQGGLVKVHTQPPRPVSGLEVRAARAEDYHQIAVKQNAFYRDYNLYQPQSADSLAEWLAHAPFGSPIQQYTMALDAKGSILAGMGTVAVGQLIRLHIVRMPLPLRLLNIALPIMPADQVIKRVLGVRFWYDENHPEAANYLWESVRWLCRDQGTGLMMFFDTSGPILKLLRFPSYGLQPPGTVVFQSPVQLSDERLLDLYHASW